jgi:hypothetical protein
MTFGLKSRKVVETARLPIRDLDTARHVVTCWLRRTKGKSVGHAQSRRWPAAGIQLSVASASYKYVSFFFGLGLALALLQVLVPILARLLERGSKDERFKGDKLLYRS